MFRSLFKRPPLSFRFTAMGTRLFVLAIIVGAGALNTGVNLLYLVFALILGFILASGVLSGLTLWDVNAALTVPENVFVGQAFHGAVSVKNLKKRFSSYSVWVHEKTVGILDGGGYFVVVPPGQRKSAGFEHTFQRRGDVRVAGLHLLTRFPFGLFEKEVSLPTGYRILVFPRVFMVNPATPLLGGTDGPQEQARKGAGSELFNLREYVPGDHPKHIHWKSSARSSNLIVREFASEEDAASHLVFDNRFPDGRRADEFEVAVSTVASIAAALLRGGRQLHFAAWGSKERDCRGEEGLYRILKVLAAIEPMDASAISSLADPSSLVTEGSNGAVAGMVLGFAPAKKDEGGLRRLDVGETASALGISLGRSA